MSKRPVVFLAFSNRQDAYLNFLKSESKSINAALLSLHSKEAIEIYREESADTDELLDIISRYKDRIELFHFAGHSDSGGLLLEDNPAQAEGLAKLLATLPNLKLVFLNGCANYKQVKRLHELGIKTIIATTAKIDDRKAGEFAEHFYRDLANKSSIKQAFEFAVGALQLKYSGLDKITPTRFRDIADTLATTDSFPWGLYHAEEEEVLNWSLPVQFSMPVMTRPTTATYDPNQYLPEILYSLCEFDKELATRALDSSGELIVGERDALAIVIEKFPWPIGVQIRLLVANEEDMRKPTLQRLKQIVSTYTVASQFLYFILISQLWEERNKRENELGFYHLDLLNINREHFLFFDFTEKSMQAIETAQRNGIPLFMPEMNNLLQEYRNAGDIFNACRFLEATKASIFSNTPPTEASLTQTNADAEFALTLMLSKIGFLISYPLIVVRDILINSPRHSSVQFQHFIGRLNVNASDNLGISKKPVPFNEFLHNSSVVLVRNLQQPHPFLSLSPFLIDKNAFGDFRATEPHLYMYAHLNNQEYVYLTTTHGIYRSLEQDANQFDTGFTVEQDMGTTRRLRGTRTNEPQRPFAPMKEQFEALRALG